ncbi:MAG: single-stranded DNA-binding protein [Streptococcaceae bacterium]|jgi:single-strand DNA-binding protein|nr:single-stranded DNA-binding protein [Streptococcaceae bacterium]
MIYSSNERGENMLNQSIIVGRLTKNAEITLTAKGKQKTSFTLAVNRSYKNEKGEVPVDFIDCILWGKQAEIFVQYTCKGALMGVMGEIHKNKYEKDGQVRYYTILNCKSFQFIEPKTVIQERMEKQGLSAVLKETGGEIPMDIVEDDLPF